MHPFFTKRIEIKSTMIFPLAQQFVVLLFGRMLLDGGQVFQIVGYAALAYWVGFGLVMARQHGRLTKVDKVLIRWGYLVLCFFVSPFVTGIIWGIRGY